MSFSCLSFKTILLQLLIQIFILGYSKQGRKFISKNKSEDIKTKSINYTNYNDTENKLLEKKLNIKETENINNILYAKATPYYEDSESTNMSIQLNDINNNNNDNNNNSTSIDNTTIDSIHNNFFNNNSDYTYIISEKLNKRELQPSLPITYTSQTEYLTNIYRANTQLSEDKKRINSKTVVDGDFVFFSSNINSTICVNYRNFKGTDTLLWYWCHQKEHPADTSYNAVSQYAPNSVDMVFYGSNSFIYHLFNDLDKDSLKVFFLRVDYVSNLIYYENNSHNRKRLSPLISYSVSDINNVSKFQPHLINAVYNCNGNKRAVYSILNVVL